MEREIASKEEIAQWYSIDVELLKGARILYAVYTYEDYSGSSDVIFSRKGKLYHVYGGHCSCDGLEGQWEPEETSYEQLKKYWRTEQFSKELWKKIKRYRLLRKK